MIDRDRTIRLSGLTLSLGPWIVKRKSIRRTAGRLTLFVTSRTIANTWMNAPSRQPAGFRLLKNEPGRFPNFSSRKETRMPVAAAEEPKRRAAKVAKLLAAEYPEAQCALEFSNPLELLIATILSAQCTDVRVNIVTPALFKKYPTAAAYATAKRPELEKAIQSTGFFRNKAKSIQECCRKLVDEHGGKLPQTIEKLVELPGVGRKTANVVLGTAYGIASGVVVDTHVTLLSQR
jgi:endonuclease-3